jgi:hypothetical protein
MEEDEDDLYAENGASETTHEPKVQTTQGEQNDADVPDAGDEDDEEEESDSDSVTASSTRLWRWSF